MDFKCHIVSMKNQDQGNNWVFEISLTKRFCLFVCFLNAGKAPQSQVS